MFHIRPTQLLTTLILTLATNLAQALPFDKLVVFGDSLSDAGNEQTYFDTQFPPPGTLREPTPIPSPDFIPSFPYASNRDTNGPVWVEQFAGKLGMSAQASLLGGTNFAFSGAETGPAGSSFPFSLTDQVEMYLDTTGGAADGSALFVVAGGGNDARAAIATALGGADPTAIVEAYIQNIVGILMRLSDSGARHILFLNVPNIGLTPALQTADAFFPGAAAAASSIASEMNTGISGVIASLSPILAPDLKLFDFYSLVTDTVANPAAYGFTDVTSACALTAECIANPDTTLFWDGIHPTTVGHSVIANAVFALVVPEPSTLALILIVGLGFVVRRYAH